MSTSQWLGWVIVVTCGCGALAVFGQLIGDVVTYRRLDRQIRQLDQRNG